MIFRGWGWVGVGGGDPSGGEGVLTEFLVIVVITVLIGLILLNICAG